MVGWLVGLSASRITGKVVDEFLWIFDGLSLGHETVVRSSFDVIHELFFSLFNIACWSSFLITRGRHSPRPTLLPTWCHVASKCMADVTCILWMLSTVTQVKLQIKSGHRCNALSETRWKEFKQIASNSLKYLGRLYQSKCMVCVKCSLATISNH